MTRHFLGTVCRALIAVVLLAQMAVSAYACPGMAAGASVQAQPEMNCEDMAGPMDTDFANLCAEHCRQGQQSDQTATVSVPAALLSELYTTPPAPSPIVAPRPAAAAPSALAAASPPLAILHCCFRI